MSSVNNSCDLTIIGLVCILIHRWYLSQFVLLLSHSNIVIVQNIDVQFSVEIFVVGVPWTMNVELKVNAWTQKKCFKKVSLYVRSQYVMVHLILWLGQNMRVRELFCTSLKINPYFAIKTKIRWIFYKTQLQQFLWHLRQK